ncbi:MAG: insulinase family protein [Gammaproteobacteria bacterium]|nr:insulinase family protein [Gammaproteobacteria bacterium]
MATAYSHFDLQREHYIDSLQVTFQSFLHGATGARHIHLAAADDNNAFMVAFPTVPQDSTGVAHILEHTALCGSQRFPVRDPFFMMLRRSLNSFMNAFTSSDSTAYPFASPNDKDFDNLLRVYLDAVFFPLLHKLDFAQEGHRTEVETDASQQRLVYKGVVFNEMKGAMSSPGAQLWQHLQSGLFPTTTYHYNSGGEPAEIVTLRHEDLKRFHASHYHPTHAVFFTYGDRPAAEHQQRIQELALKDFRRDERSWQVPDERRYLAPVTFDHTYAIDDDDLTEKTHIVWGWLGGRSLDIDEVLDGHMLAGILLDNSASPLLAYLESCPLAAAPSELCGLEDGMREMVFCCGVEGSEPEHADRIEQDILAVLGEVAGNGVDHDIIEALIDRMEMSQRDITGHHFPYGLQLLSRMLTPAMHRGDPLTFVEIEPALQRLRERAGHPDYVATLVRSYLLDNPHRVRIVMRPSTTVAQARLDAERAQLDDRLQQLAQDEIAALESAAAELAERQARVDDVSVLPDLTLEDVPASSTHPSYYIRQLEGRRATCYARGTNGIAYRQLVVPFPEFSTAQVPLLPLFADYLTELGDDKRDYRQAQLARAAAGNFNARLSLRPMVDDPTALQGYLVIAGKTLRRKYQRMADELARLFESTRFDEYEHLLELLAQSRADAENGITDRGHVIAMQAAGARLSASALLDHQWSGADHIRQLRTLVKQTRSGTGVAAVGAELTALANQMRARESEWLLIGEQQFLDSLPADAGDTSELSANQQEPWLLRPDCAMGDYASALTTNTEVSFCSSAYRAVTDNDPSAPALAVLARYLTNGFLHQSIREQGGAYGGGASYNADSGLFYFYSYRDPRTLNTFEDFARAGAWLLEHRDGKQLEEAILGVIRDIDQPLTPASGAVKDYFGRRHGRDASFVDAYRARTLQTTMDDIVVATERFLLKAQPARAVVTNTAGAHELEQEGFAVEPL